MKEPCKYCNGYGTLGLPPQTCHYCDGKGFKLDKDIGEEIEKGVTWQEAFEAGLEGKKIKVYGQYLTYPKFETLHFALAYLGIRPTYYKDLLKKEWYIQD